MSDTPYKNGYLLTLVSYSYNNKLNYRSNTVSYTKNYNTLQTPGQQNIKSQSTKVSPTIVIQTSPAHLRTFPVYAITHYSYV